MSLDPDAIGLIAAGCVVFLFLFVCSMVIACKYYRCVERKRLEKLANMPAPYPPSYSVEPPPPSQSSHSGIPFKLANYTPKIFGTTMSQEELLKSGGECWSEPENRRQNKYQKKEQRRRKYSTDTEIKTANVDGKIVSIVNVNGGYRDDEDDDDGRPNGHWVYDHNSPGQGGFVVKGYMVQGHIVPEQYPQTVQQSQFYQGHQLPQRETGGFPVMHSHVVATPEPVQSEGQFAFPGDREPEAEVVRGHYVTPSDGHPVRGHVIKQNVSVEEDGKVLVTLRQDGSDVIQSQTTISQAELEGSSYERQSANAVSNITTVTQQAEAKPVETTSEVVTDVYSFAKRSEEPIKRQEAELTRSLITPEERVVTWPQQEQTSTDVIAAIPTVDQTVKASDFDRQALEVESVQAVQGAPMLGVQGAVDTGASNQSENYKVIKKHYHVEHTKLPDWMIQEYEENDATMNIDDDADDDEDKGNLDLNTYMNSAVPTSGFHTGAPGVNGVYANYIQPTTEERSEVPQYENATDFTTADFVDPQPRGAVQEIVGGHEAARAASQGGDAIYQNYISPPSSQLVPDAQAATTTTTTTSVRQLRQVFSESAEGVPSSFTSTPRFVAESTEHGAGSGFVRGGAEQVFRVESRRQRTATDGTVDFLPPPPPPLPPTL
ncbi:uncharacterized protein LOC101860082 [Aplysia californica]|uniref:Uncharacterized protein LOC101860082 n=1 Tax=Aplysia californica TaxID=6500 RepID=A0ABM0JI75_APLCA|nr:uncharacterized protein LOC101860082 [Aplysia californica]XP_005094208.1 uncharacterized protein LOC101860082 [Aplysia californica]XP_012935616.1 uncharacterized protein LOC101860082 [Aplysia californica]